MTEISYIFQVVVPTTEFDIQGDTDLWCYLGKSFVMNRLYWWKIYIYFSWEENNVIDTIAF